MKSGAMREKRGEKKGLGTVKRGDGGGDGGDGRRAFLRDDRAPLFFSFFFFSSFFFSLFTKTISFLHSQFESSAFRCWWWSSTCLPLFFFCFAIKIWFQSKLIESVIIFAYFDGLLVLCECASVCCLWPVAWFLQLISMKLWQICICMTSWISGRASGTLSLHFFKTILLTKLNCYSGKKSISYLRKSLLNYLLFALHWVLQPFCRWRMAEKARFRVAEPCVERFQSVRPGASGKRHRAAPTREGGGRRFPLAPSDTGFGNPLALEVSQVA